MSTSVSTTRADKIQFVLTLLEASSVPANPILLETLSKAVLILMNAQLWKDHVETMPFVKTLRQDTTVFVHKVIVQNLMQRLHASKLT